MAAEQRRIVMWCIPRTLSTAFCRVMVSRDKCKTLVEPSVPAYYLGEERIGFFDERPIWFPDELPAPNCTWKDLARELNDPYEGYKEVFSKDMPYRLQTFHDRGTLHDIYPSNYVHVFLIRDPIKVMPSFDKLYWKLVDPDAVRLPPEKKRAFHEFPECSMVEMKNFYDWVVKEKGYRPLVVDADELQANPEKVLRRFCEFVRIEYQDAMVNWPPVPADHADVFQRYNGAWEQAGTTEGILPPTPAILDPNLPEDIRIAIEKARPFYEYLKSKEADRDYLSGQK